MRTILLVLSLIVSLIVLGRTVRQHEHLFTHHNVAQAAPPQFTCAVIGDSIAEMIQEYLPECDHNTKIGISSAAVLARVLVESPRTVIVVSAGSNDPSNPRLSANLVAIRAHGPVIWIIPSPAVPQARRVVAQFVVAHNEPAIHFTPGNKGLQSRVHPIRPQEIAAAIRALPIWKGKK